MTDKEILRLAQAELRAMYKRLGINGSNVLTLIDEALQEGKGWVPCEDYEPKQFDNQTNRCQTIGHIMCCTCKFIASPDLMEFPDVREKYYPNKQQP